MDPCSLRGCLFRVGGSVTSGGSSSRLSFLAGSGSTRFSSSWLSLAGLETSASSSPMDGSPFVQQLISILARVLGQWLLRLYKVMMSSGREVEVQVFDFVLASQPGGAK